MSIRESHTNEPELITDPAEKALAEARNALRQFDVGMVLLDHWLDGQSHKPNIRTSDLLTLNRFALDGVHRFAGTFRTTEVVIRGSQHQPPSHVFVAELIEDFCDFVNSNWRERSAEYLAAYALWRINWIHPFADGNGRTARIVSYVLLSAKLGFRLPGSNTIPEQISADKEPYYRALEAADRAFLKGAIDVSQMEYLISTCLERQLIESLPGESVSAPAEKSSKVLIDAELLESLMPLIERSLLTHKETDRKQLVSVFERNPVLIAGLFSILSALIGSILTIFFSK